MRPLHIKKAKTASPMGQKTMKPATIRAIQAGLPQSSSRITISFIASSLSVSPLM